MRSRTSDWLETKIKYDKVQEDGSQKKVTELYVVDALSFGEAEEKITREMKSYVTGEYSVKNITPANYHEIFFSDNSKDDKWYKAKLQFITIDEKTEKEKRQTVFYLVQGNSTESAQKAIAEVMGQTMIDYVVVSISETKILDVFEHSEEDDKNKDSDKSSSNGSIDEFE